MPRLLLVDDNPSIHRIAESLLAPTDVELVCVDSAAEALDRIGRGERFDVALVDTAMPGMDGWTLLSRLRSMEATALMPIALMAGVLDPVDPAKLAKAPIQGFLKKPIELRELGDRVKALLASPVMPAPSPFSTVPATPARDLVKRAEAALPEFRHEPVPEPVPEPVDVPTGLLDADLNLPEPEDDLLVLTPEDLWPEAPAIPEEVVVTPVLPDVHLELEELDFESLQDLGGEPLPEAEPMPGAAPEPALAPVAATSSEEEHLVTLSGLEELDSLPREFLMPVPEPAPEPAIEPDDFLAHLPLPGSLLDGDGVAEAAALATHEPVPASQEPAAGTHESVAAQESAWPLESVAPVIVPAAGGQISAVPGQAAPVSPEQAQALLQALLADPVLVDALVKAVVTRMGDQVLREIAWEVMPDLAGRLQR